MASFTFETGNSRALSRVPLYLLGVLATALVPRTRRIWVFGSGIGLGEGALALYYLARARLGPDVRLVWLATTSAELAQARELGFDAVRKLGPRGLWLTLRAHVLVVTHGHGDVNRYGVRGGFVVQLWHGIPLKRLHLDSPVALRSSLPGRLVRAVLARGYRTAGRLIGLFPVASERGADRIASAFGLPRERILVTGDPRNDVLLQGTEAHRRAHATGVLAAALGPLPPAARVVLYAPTWRDGDIDPALPDDRTWDDIAGWLERTDAVLVVRNHPLGRGDYAPGPARSPRIRLLGADLLADVTPVLPAVDALVTDYSSIAFDYSLVGGPTVFLAPDVASYVRSRGLYEPYRTFSGGRHVASWSQVLTVLDGLRDDPEVAAAAAAHATWLRDEHFDHLDGRATERVLAEILRRADGTTTGTPDTPDTPDAPDEHRARPVVTALRFDADQLILEIDRAAPHFSGARLDGPRERVEAVVESTGGSLVARFPLLVTRWGAPGLALPSGDYRLVLIGEPPTTRVELGTTERPRTTHELFRAGVHAEAGGVLLRMGPPLAEDESRPVPHRNLREVYFRGATRPENGVYFESFYGQSASCNPLGIDRALARSHPEVRRYWSVADGSVAVPPGAIRIVEGSREWWRVRAEARVYVINDWLRWSFRRRRHQRVLQTWHGTMLKRLALDRADARPRMRFAIVRQQWRWHALLAQNYYSARIFRSAYAVRAPIWETGYPRNDIFASPEEGARVRAAVGIPPGARVVLYAPTWRDDRSEMVDHLDLVAFAAELPGDHVLLVRGHSRTLAFGQDLTAHRLVDVTSYPDVADLMLIADVLVTDYSSVMFDFASTGKPTVFFTPDIAHYGDVLRGFYFDLLADAPGPVVTTREELVAAVVGANEIADKYATQRLLWREKFTPHDDGHAADRVVQKMYDEGWLR